MINTVEELLEFVDKFESSFGSTLRDLINPKYCKYQISHERTCTLDGVSFGDIRRFVLYNKHWVDLSRIGDNTVSIGKITSHFPLAICIYPGIRKILLVGDFDSITTMNNKEVPPL